MKANTRGFTIIELMLAMMFLTSILLISSTVIVQAFGMYNKGLVIKQINQAGRTLTEDMTRAANNAAVTDDLDSNTHVLCLGSSVYAWNTPEQIRPPSTDIKRYVSGQPINFVKIDDASACTSSTAVRVDEDNATSLLSENIRVFSVEITKVAGDVVNIEFVFGTYDASDPNSVINPKETSPGKWECDGTSLGNYCAFGVYSTTLYLPNPKEQG